MIAPLMRLGGRVAAAAIAVAASLGAQTTTIEDMLRSLERGAVLADLRTVDPIAARKLDSLARALRDADAGSITLETMSRVIASRTATIRQTARWDARPEALLNESWFRSAMITLPLIANGSIGLALRERGVPREQLDDVLRPTDQLGRLVGERALERNEEKLRRYEIKYGPDSPRLNLAEVGLNYLAQLRLPLFQPTTDGWPSRYEVIAAYRTMELTAAKAADEGVKPRLVSGNQIGVRWYHFAPQWGTGDRIDRVVRPRHASTGVFFMGPRDMPLENPWAKGKRVGAFLGWGSAYVAYVWDQPRRIVAGSGKQIVPYVF